MRWGIRYRLLVPPGLLLVGVAGVSAWAALAAADRAERHIAAQVRDVAHTLADASWPLTSRILSQMKGLSGAEYLLVRGDGGRESTLPAADAVPVSALAAASEVTADGLGPPVEVAGEVYRCGRLTLPPTHPNAGGTVYILYPEATRREALWDAVRPPLVLGVGGALLAATVGLAVGHRLVRRIRELERRTRLIAAGDFSPMPLPRQHDELADLTRSVNDMAGQLARLQDAVRATERLRLLGQLSGGLAHQLRNGVAGARLAVQLHGADCPAGDREALDVALRQMALVEATLRRFLDLGRPGRLRRERCSLNRLVGEAVALWRPQCKHAGTDLRWEPPAADAPVEGDADQIGDLLLNVIGNAIEAAGPGGSVEVVLRVGDGGPHRVEVIDSGPGPPAGVAGRLFEPFVTGKPEGIGLGLAVAKHAAEAHGGRIDWRHEGGRTCFVIELPAANV
jgi:signal transduction histidine kinase